MSVPVLVFGAIVVLVAAAVTLYYRLTREEGTHKAPSTRLPPSGRRVARAGRRAAGAARRLPGATWLRSEWHGLGDWDDHDAQTAAVFHQIRIELHHEEDLPAPTRGDAQGRAVRVCADESRPAAGADLTGSLSPRTDEGRRLASAPPAPAFHGGRQVALVAHADTALWQGHTETIACSSCVDTDAGLACQADLGGQCPSGADPALDEHGLPPMSAALARALQEAEDAQRWPELMPRYGYQDATGEFTRIVAEAVA